MNGFRVRTVSTSLGEWISSGNEWSQSPCHPVSGSTCPGLAIGAWCGKGTAPGCAWCLRGAMLLRGCRLFGVALHQEPKGTKRYQAMAIEPHYMRPVILHGFGTSAKKRMPNSLADVAQFGWLPLAAALFGTHEWKPQWLHHNVLPVVGLRLHAKVSSPPLSQAQLILLCGLWQRKGTIGTLMYVAAASSSPEVWSSVTFPRNG